MKRWLLRRLIKVLASSDAMIAACVELSEVSNAHGYPLDETYRTQWQELAARVAIEMANIRKDVGQ